MIQYNDTGTGSYPLPVEVPWPVLLGVGARSRCRCSRHSVIQNLANPKSKTSLKLMGVKVMFLRMLQCINKVLKDSLGAVFSELAAKAGISGDKVQLTSHT